MSKALLLFKISLILILSAAHFLPPSSDNMLQQTLVNLLKMQTTADAVIDISPDVIPLADGSALFIVDEDVPLAESFFEFADYILQLYELANAERQKVGLNELEVSGLLQIAAAFRAAELEELYAHTRPDGRDWVTIRTDFGFSGRGVGENLNKNHTTPETTMISWMNSAEHKTNILMPEWNKMGAGIFVGVDGTMYWVMLYTD